MLRLRTVVLLSMLVWRLALGGSSTAPTTNPMTPYAGLILRDDGAGKTLVSRIMPGPLRGRGFEAPQLTRGDIVVSINGLPMNARQFEDLIKSAQVGDEIVLQTRRTGSARVIPILVASAEGKLEEIRFKLDEARDWQGPVDFKRAAGSLDESMAAVDRTIAPTTAPTQLERFIDDQLASHGLTEPTDRLLALLTKMQRDAWGHNTLSRVAYGFVHPKRLLRLQKSITDPLQVVASDPRQLLVHAADLLDVPQPIVTGSTPINWSDPAAVVETIASKIDSAQADVESAFVMIETGKLEDLRSSIRELLAQLASSDSVEASPHADRLIRAMQWSTQVHYQQLLRAATSLSFAMNLAPPPPTTQPTTRAATQATLPDELAGAVSGDVLAFKKCGPGWIVFGGDGANQYDMSRIVAVIDAGGDDVYQYRGNKLRDVQLIVDLGGDDRYTADDDAACGPGGALMGVSLIVDVAGDDVYHGNTIACGAGVMGVGMVVDRAGNDRYDAKSWSEGAGFYGVGAIVDLGGTDVYIGQILSQAIGGPRGVGLILDSVGNDLYRVNGPTLSAYGTPGVFFAMSQGVGFGVRNYDSGGIGILEDLSGDDRYEGGEFAQGGGYFQGMGILHDCGGSDAYFGNRYAQGFAAHDAIGVLVDDAGDDMYWGMTAASQAGSWDLSVVMLLDLAGNDTYHADGLSQGAAAEQAIAWLIDLAGDDHYVAAGTAVQGQSGENSYHYHATKCFSWSLLLDAGGGRDVYSSGRENDKIVSTGAANDKQPELTDLHGLFMDVAEKIEAP